MIANDRLVSSVYTLNFEWFIACVVVVCLSSPTVYSGSAEHDALRVF
jgi:hypothetical protein